MADPPQPAPDIALRVDLVFRDTDEPLRIAWAEVELLGSVFPELVAELAQTRKEE